MKVLNIIGADLSKETIDFATHRQHHLKVTNNLQGFAALVKWLDHEKINRSDIMIVMEHTGHYSYRLEHFLDEQNIPYAKVSALAIKRSMGLVRGKNDRIDAVRIARYGFEKMDQLEAFHSCSINVEKLKMLYATRQRLVHHRTALINALKDCGEICGLRKADVIMQAQQKLVKTFDQQIVKLEQEIERIMDSDQTLRNNYRLVQSVIGVGKIIALATITKSGNFTRFPNAKKFACYSGTAPFENTSGSSIRGRTRVSHLADKDMKSKLHLAAKCAVQFDPEIRQYYQKRIAEGKSKMSTLNIVCNKIIARMFAVVKRQTPFINNYLKIA